MLTNFMNELTLFSYRALRDALHISRLGILHGVNSTFAISHFDEPPISAVAYSRVSAYALMPASDHASLTSVQVAEKLLRRRRKTWHQN